MSTPRSTALAERLIVVLCIVGMVGFMSYELGRYVEYKQCPAPNLKQGIRKLSVHDMTKQSQRVWAKYLAVRG